MQGAGADAPVRIADPDHPRHLADRPRHEAPTQLSLSSPVPPHPWRPIGGNQDTPVASLAQAIADRRLNARPAGSSTGQDQRLGFVGHVAEEPTFRPPWDGRILRRDLIEVSGKAR